MMLKSYPNSVLQAVFPYSNFESCTLKNVGAVSEIQILLSLRDFLVEEEKTAWFNTFNREAYKIEVLLIKDKKLFDNLSVSNIEETKKNKKFVKIFSLSAVLDIIGKSNFVKDLEKEYVTDEYEIFKTYYSARFTEPSFYDDRFIGFACYAKIDENSDPTIQSTIKAINLDNVLIDKFILVDNFIVNYSKVFNIYKENNQEFLWYGKNNISQSLQQKDFTVKDVRIIQPEIKNQSFNSFTKPANLPKPVSKKINYFSDLIYGIDEDLNIKSTFFFNYYDYLVENSQIYKKLNSNFITKDKILGDDSILTSFDLSKNVIIQNKPYFKNKDAIYSQQVERQEFIFNKNLDFNIQTGIKAIDVIDYNVNGAYNDAEFTYTINFGLIDTIYGITKKVYDDAFSSLATLKEMKNFLFANLYFIRDGKYINYNFDLGTFSETFLKNNKKTIDSYKIPKIIENFINIDFLLSNKKNPQTKQQVEKLINPEFCSFEDVESFIARLETFLARLAEILSVQKNGGQYSVTNNFTERIFLDSSLYALAYTKPSDSDSYSPTFQSISALNSLPLLSPYSLIVKDFTGNFSNERANLIFQELFKKDVKEILNLENIDLYDELMKNISLKKDLQKANTKLTKKTTNFSVNRESLNNFKFKLFTQISKNTFNIDKKTTRVESKQQYLDSIKGLSNEKKTNLYKSIYGDVKEKTNKQIEDEIIELSSRFFDEFFVRTTNLTNMGKTVQVHENPYLSFLNQIFLGEVVRLEYLSGFNFDYIQGIFNIKKPIWRPMSISEFRRKTTQNSKNNKTTLCRLVLVKPEDFLTNKDNLDLNLTKLYQSFILKYS